MLKIESNFSRSLRSSKVGESIITTHSQSAACQLAKTYGAQVTTKKSDLIYSDGKAGKKLQPVVIVTVVKAVDESEALISAHKPGRKKKTTE